MYRPAGVNRKIKPQELFRQVNIVGANKKPANYFTCATPLKLLVSYVVLYTYA